VFISQQILTSWAYQRTAYKA